MNPHDNNCWYLPWLVTISDVAGNLIYMDDYATAPRNMNTLISIAAGNHPSLDLLTHL